MIPHHNKPGVLILMDFLMHQYNNLLYKLMSGSCRSNLVGGLTDKII